MKSILRYLLLGASAFSMLAPAFANPCPPGNPPTNCAPPTAALLDLHGTPVPHVYTQYFTSFVATDVLTNLSFAFREDPAFLFLDDISLTTGGGANLVNNPGFELGPVGANAPTGWSFLNTFGATFAGVVNNGGGHGGSMSYMDGAVQAYDGITQSIATMPGNTYNLSFWLMDNGLLTTFSRLSTNGNVSSPGGNGIDLLVYAGAVPTLDPPLPEPGVLAMLAPGLLALALLRRRRGAG